MNPFTLATLKAEIAFKNALAREYASKFYNARIPQRKALYASIRDKRWAEVQALLSVLRAEYGLDY